MRYYTLCKFTGIRKEKYYGKEIALYSNAPDAFIFHDTQAEITYRDVAKPLFHLSKLHADANHAWLVQRDANTLVATFSLRAAPLPLAYKVYDYGIHDYKNVFYPTVADNLSLTLLEGINTGMPAMHTVNLSQQFDRCEQLSKLAGMCPCPMADDRSCATANITPVLSQITTAPDLNSFYLLDNKTKWFQRTAYKTLDGFDYVSPTTATEYDFVPALRDWDDYDFTCVETRKRIFSDRGSLRAKVARHVKAECTKCTFKVINYKGVVQGCGQERVCTKAASEDQVWSALYSWYANSGFDIMPGFSTNERNYLMQLGNPTYSSNALTFNTRKIETVCAGFRALGGGDWGYRVSPAKGRLDRSRLFDSYASLQAEMPDLPKIAPPTAVIPKKTLLAYAVMASRREVVNSLNQKQESLYTLTLSSGYVELRGCHSWYLGAIDSLLVSAGAANYARYAFLPTKFTQLHKVTIPMSDQNQDI